MSRFAALPRWCALVGLLALSVGLPAARAVVIATEGIGSQVAPGNDPGWKNVGRVAGASGVYLGNGWVITANHVSLAPFVRGDGKSFASVPGSDIRINNPAGSGTTGSADLRMFRLVDDPALPSLPIGTVSPQVGNIVTMIGAGVDRQVPAIGWRTSTTGATTNWTQTPLPLSTTFGFGLDTTSHMQWGVNQVATGPILSNANTIDFSTRFDRLTLPLEAQAVTGDSGGGVFELTSGTWNLVGIMTSEQLLPGQPANTVVFGDSTLIADLSFYRQQITGVLDQPDNLWRNDKNYYDVDRSGKANRLDVVTIATELKRHGTRPLTGTPSATDLDFDVNGDGKISTADALAVLQALNGSFANVTPLVATDPNVVMVPEPSTVALAGLGVVLLAVARFWRGRLRRGR